MKLLNAVFLSLLASEWIESHSPPVSEDLPRLGRPNMVVQGGVVLGNGARQCGSDLSLTQ